MQIQVSEVYFCKGQGYISRVWSKRSQQDELQKGTAAICATAKGKPQPTYQIDEDTVSVVSAQSGKVGVKITLEVADRQIPMEVDTGATVTVIPISVYEQYLSHVQVHASTVTLKTYSGGSLKVKGKATVPVRYGEQHATAKIIGVDVLGKAAILGRNWSMKQFGSIRDLCSVLRQAKFLTPRRSFQGHLVRVWVLYKGMRQELH